MALALLALSIIASCGSDRSDENNNIFPPHIVNPKDKHSGDAIPFEEGKYLASLTSRFFVKLERLKSFISNSPDNKIALYFLNKNSGPATAVAMISFELYYPANNHKSDQSRQFFYRDPKYPDLVEVDGLNFNYSGKEGAWHALIIARVDGEKDSALITLPEVF